LLGFEHDVGEIFTCDFIKVSGMIYKNGLAFLDLSDLLGYMFVEF